MIKKIILSGVFILGLIVCMQAQYSDTLNVKINQDSRIDSLIKLHHQVNQRIINHEEHDGIKGYRIQLYMDSGNNSKSNVNNRKVRFEQRYPKVKAYLIFKEPFFKLRVGDFRTKLEAEGFLNRLNRRYPGSFVVADKIKFPTL